MFLKLLFAFTVVPAVELYLLISIGSAIGPGPTVGLILITGLVGASLAKREGLAVLRQIQTEAQAGFPSGDRMLEAVMVLVGGVLLLTPGVVTDALGLSLIIPLTRRLLRPLLKRWLLRRVQVIPPAFDTGGMDPPEPARDPSPQGATPFDHPVR